MGLQSLLQITQFGTSTFDEAMGIEADGNGNFYVTGNTRGNLFGLNLGSLDVWIAKYDSEQNVLWSRQLGSTGTDRSVDIAVDGSGNAYITGTTTGQLGDSNPPGEDPWLAKFDPDGNRLWTRQLAVGPDAWDINADYAGNVYVSISNDSGSLLKYDTDGNLLWSIQSDSFSNASTGTDIDSNGNVFVVSPIGNYDLAKYSSNGERLWSTDVAQDVTQLKLLSSPENTEIRSIPGSRVSAHDVAVDSSGNVYAIGRTSVLLGDEQAQGTDVWVAKYDTLGNLTWIQQFGSVREDFADGIAVDQHNRIYVSGYTSGDLGAPNAGSYDAFLAQLDSDGQVLDIAQWGTDREDVARFVRVNSNGDFYISGWTDGTLGQASFGDRDGWFGIIKSTDIYGPPPEVSINNASTREGNQNTSSLTFTVSLSPASTLPITVHYQTIDASAIAGEDYQATSGTLTFLAGETSQSIAVKILGDDVVETDETFSIVLSSPSYGVLLDEQGIGLLLNDDADHSDGQSTPDSDAFKFGTLPPSISFNQGRKGEVIRGTNQGDRLRGTRHNDVLIGRSGKNKLNGRSGQDIIRGGRHLDRLNGGVGNDRITAKAGHDQLKGDRGDDLLQGGKGNDLLVGGAGDDILMGQGGADRLKGGSGSDVFVLQSIGDAGDTILDFDSREDLLDIRGIVKTLKLSADSLLQAFQEFIHLKQVGSAVTVSADADGTGHLAAPTLLLTLQNVQVNTLGTENFVAHG